MIRDVHRSFSRALQARAGGHGVSMAQWYFLRALWEEDGLTQRELSQRVGMMEPTTVAAVNAMERRGFVRRVRNEYDRRKVNIHLTAKGRSLRPALTVAAAELNGHAVAGIDPVEVERAVGVLNRVVANLASLSDSGAAESPLEDRAGDEPI
ncbi:MarR family winged helix-turn-helix transcriptional regulator [Azospirillum halopraeferens]|uniref:MarR family winged helix-turn-helix transcriptional regulator n=1 Tax=Azospirillum halopraeferens TaxID=34010 RepID=UPI0004139F06|nr:MarR family transcriptional regulator [Azospirillum halopraeferens]